jgi:hypothetical protein
MQAAEQTTNAATQTKRLGNGRTGNSLENRRGKASGKPVCE